MSRLTLPGDLPGLLQPGCPVVWLDCIHDHGECRGWVVEVEWDDSDPLQGALTPVVLLGDGDVGFISPSRLALDVSQPAGQDRARRWVGEFLVGKGPSEVLAFADSQPPEVIAALRRVMGVG